MPIIDITTFRLADGVDETAFLERDERARTGFLYHQPGMARATTARSADGEWAVIVLWSSEEHADAADGAAATDDATTDLMALVDRATMTRRRYETFD